MTAAPGSRLPFFWLTVCYHSFWLLVPNDVGMMIAAFLLTFSFLLIMTLDGSGPEEQHLYVPKMFRPLKDMWIKSMFKTIKGCAEPLFNKIIEINVRCRHRTQGHQSAGPQRRRRKKFPRDQLYHDPIPVMTTTWVNVTSDTPSGHQLDSNSRALMLHCNQDLP